MTTGQLHDRVVHRWGREIVSGERAAGSRISTERAAEQLGVSRTVIREAVRVLESMGLLAVRRRLGITVLGPDSWNPFDPSIIRWQLAGRDRLVQLKQIAELRSGVEPLAARLAAVRATPADCGALTRAVIGMSTTARRAADDDYLAHHAEFHRVLLRASGNPMLAGLLELVTEGMAGRPRPALMPAEVDPQAIQRHGLVASAIQAGDPDAAERAMRAIVARAADAIGSPRCAMTV